MTTLSMVASIPPFNWSTRLRVPVMMYSFHGNGHHLQGNVLHFRGKWYRNLSNIHNRSSVPAGHREVFLSSRETPCRGRRPFPAEGRSGRSCRMLAQHWSLLWRKFRNKECCSCPGTIVGPTFGRPEKQMELVIILIWYLTKSNIYVTYFCSSSCIQHL